MLDIHFWNAKDDKNRLGLKTACYDIRVLVFMEFAVIVFQSLNKRNELFFQVWELLNKSVVVFRRSNFSDSKVS